MEQFSLFEQEAPKPLAEKLRPATLEEYAGQQHLLGEGKLLRRLIEEDMVSSMILWGPPGTGKTTLARIIAGATKAEFINFSAVMNGIKDIRGVMDKAEEQRHFGKKTIVFVDEIHRFNKAQQDAFLPFVEKGSIILIGATTENPSFEVNGALLSRCKVFVLKALTAEDIEGIIKRALESPEGFGGQKIEFEGDIPSRIALFANGDARVALSTLEMVIINGEMRSDGSTYVSVADLEQCISKKSLLYDKNGEEHYNLISALHKSMRNSDPDAAVYYLARMLEAGEDPIYIARRVTRFASEDVGLADPFALNQAVSAFEACRLIGMPECSVHLTQAVIYMSLAPKSNSMEAAYFAARDAAVENMAEPVPLHIRNAPTELMKELEYGKGYKYAHDYEGHITAMTCLPDNLADAVFYEPGKLGKEAEFAKRLKEIKEWKEKHKGR